MGDLYVFLQEVSVQVLCPFFNWMFVFLVLSHMRSLHILEIQHLSEVSLANIFSHMVGCLFIFLTFSLAMKKLFIFDEIPFVYYFLYAPCSRGHICENIAAWNI